MAQVVTYAEALGCPEAILVYPIADAPPLDVHIGSVRVRSALFALARDFEAAEQDFVKYLCEAA